MFERYTEKARRVIFFARYEASNLGGQSIEPEHILLGILRENSELLAPFSGNHRAAADAIRQEIIATNLFSEPLPASADIPISAGAKRVLSAAAAESQRLGHLHIGPEHLLLGVIKEGSSFASRLLGKRGVTEEMILSGMPGENAQPPPSGQHRIWNAEGVGGGGGFPMGIPLSSFVRLIDILVDRGIITREELEERIAATPSPSAVFPPLSALLDLLVSKGVLSEEDRRDIIKGE